ncbi:MAG: PLP-dependent aminotransferase family protein [Desulfovibrio sp.]
MSEEMFAERMGNVHRSFIREILKVTADPSIISFAGGLPNPELFPSDELAKTAEKVLSGKGTRDASSSLQYSTTEGDPLLREYIAERYRKNKGLDVSADDIVITTGSQQCLDIISKVFLNKGDKVLIERPGYLGAIQAMSFFEPEFLTVGLESDGPNLKELEEQLAKGVKLFYTVPNFQNPSGLTYSEEKRKAVAELVEKSGALYIEDDPYGELRFKGEHKSPLFKYLSTRGILLGSFSKVAAPGFRIGWLVVKQDEFGRTMREKLVIAKQAADLHTSTFAQRVVQQYVEDNDLDAHIAKICDRYGSQRDVMVEAIREHFPKNVDVTEPEGGMFLWATMPEGNKAMDLFDIAIKQKVAFVPGTPFYVDDAGSNTFRLNYSNASPENIREGIKRLGESLHEFLS